MEEFKSEQDLYNALLPALKTKINELKNLNIDYIKKEDVWNYLKINKWRNSSNLLIHEMVDDILNVDAYKLDGYIKKELQNTKKKPIIESGEENEQ